MGKDRPTSDGKRSCANDKDGDSRKMHLKQDP